MRMKPLNQIMDKIALLKHKYHIFKKMQDVVVDEMSGLRYHSIGNILFLCVTISTLFIGCNPYIN